MLTHLLVALILSSNASGKTLVRTNPGRIVPVSAKCKTIICGYEGMAVSHVYFDGSTIRDTRGVTWSKNGTPTMVARSGAVPPGVGGLSDTVHYTLPGDPAGNDVLDLSGGSFAFCLVFKPVAADFIVPYAFPFSNGVYNTVGYYVQITNNTEIGRMEIYGSTTDKALSGTKTSADTLSVVCAGRTGNDSFIKLNLGATGTATPASWTAGTSTVAYLGRYGGATGRFLNGTLYEGIWINQNLTAAQLTDIQTQVKTKLGISAW